MYTALQLIKTNTSPMHAKAETKDILLHNMLLLLLAVLANFYVSFPPLYLFSMKNIYATLHLLDT